MIGKAFEENAYGIAVKRCCASCRYKEVSRLVRSRRCVKHKKIVKPSDVCDDWEMSETLKSAGRSKGVVRDVKTKQELF